MIDTKDFNFLEGQSNFDFKGLMMQVISQWKFFLAAWFITFSVAYYINIRKEKIYAMENTIVLKEESNPFFTSNTSLTFNWGGISNEVQNITSTLNSRSHNEIVVDKLQFFINYLKQGDYNIVDAYGEVPFFINIDKMKGQLYGQNIKIKFLDERRYQIEIPFESESVSVVQYSTNAVSSTAVQKGIYSKVFVVGQQVSLPFLNWKLEINDNPGIYKGNEYFVSFSSFDATVSKYRGLSVTVDAKGGSILKLGLQGTNKARMVKYLNSTIEILQSNQLKMKNQFATNTIDFIDSTLISMERQLKENANELKSFTAGKNVFEIQDGGAIASGQLLQFDIKKDEVTRKLNYYNSLKKYLTNSTDFSKLPAPSVAGIEDANIVVNVSKLISLSTQRSELSYAVKSEKIFQDFDKQMNAVKNVLLENISTAKQSLQYEMNLIASKINESESNIRRLPTDQQELFKIKRKYDLNENVYNSFMAKKSEADIVRAANLSDIKFIDPAKDTGGGLIGPRTEVNYIIAFFVGFFIPFVILFGLFYFNNTIYKIEDIGILSKIPIIGVVGRKVGESNLAVFEKPKSALSESFRTIRSSLQFLYRRQNVEGAKVLMLTSSVSGEGKTFCSMNIGTVFALSEKKTVILGLDLRKPKIFEDFNILNDIGMTSYLSGQNNTDEVIQKTHIPYLDVITSGPMPPNPSELLMSDGMKELMTDLKQRYDYIILDTPPVGLVSDALELADFSDLVLYVVRQNYTTKEMITVLNNRTKRGELKNVSIIVNDFQNKSKYGYGYGYGYGTKYDSYLDDDHKGLFHKLKSRFTKALAKVNKSN